MRINIIYINIYYNLYILLQNKIKKKEYSTLNDIHEDLKLMQENARTYNKKNSLVCKDAATILVSIVL